VPLPANERHARHTDDDRGAEPHPVDANGIHDGAESPEEDILLSIVLAIAAFWELLEWWTALVVASDVGTAFLGSQGDPWDAQWDMLLALIGAAAALLLLGRAHDRSMARVFSTAGARSRGTSGDGPV
jgi:hypothetical protein